MTTTPNWSEHFTRIAAAKKRVIETYSQSDIDAANLIFNSAIVTDGISGQPRYLKIAPKSNINETVDIDLGNLLYEQDIDIIANRLVDIANDKIRAGLIPDYKLASKSKMA
jgi:hypothetical protein